MLERKREPESAKVKQAEKDIAKGLVKTYLGITSVAVVTAAVAPVVIPVVATVATLAAVGAAVKAAAKLKVKMNRK